MFGLLKKPQPVLDDASIDWLFDTYHWFLPRFDARIFREQTQLITPTNAHFPGRVDSVEGMAGLIFDAVKAHAGLSHWPCQLVEQGQFSPADYAAAELPTTLRLAGPGAAVDPDLDRVPLMIPYDAGLVGQPESLIASFAHLLAYHLIQQQGEAPPGGEENLPHSSEVLAVFMGFGLMFANTAYSFRRGGCGGCSTAGRFNYLSQYDVTYALAIFCRLKEIPGKAALRHLKRPLAPFFKQALADVGRREVALSRLRNAT